MNRELIKTLLRLEVSAAVKRGVPLQEAVEQAGKKLREGMERAEFESYCSNHDC